MTIKSDESASPLFRVNNPQLNKWLKSYAVYNRKTDWLFAKDCSILYINGGGRDDLQTFVSG